MDREATLDVVRSVVSRLVDKPEFDAASLSDESCVIELGLTSLELIDLTVALEDELMIEEFPLQDWIDQENQRGAEGFRINSIVDICMRIAP